MFDFLLPDVRLWFWLGAIAAFVGGFFAKSEGSAFQRGSGTVFLGVLFLLIMAAMVLVGIHGSVGSAVVTFFIYWVILGLGAGLMVRLNGRSGASAREQD